MSLLDAQSVARDLMDPDAHLGAVVRVRPDDRPALLAAALSSDAVRALAVDFAATQDASALRTAIASGLDYPDHYAGNWDALTDIFYEIQEDQQIEVVLLLIEDALHILRDHPEERELFHRIVADLLTERQAAREGAPVLLRVLDLASEESDVGAISVSVSLYFGSYPDPEPSVLAGARGRSPRVAGYHFARHVHDVAAPSKEINDFLNEQLHTLESAGVTAEWVAERGGRSRAYVSIHSGVRIPALELDADATAGLARLGASLLVDVL